MPIVVRLRPHDAPLLGHARGADVVGGQLARFRFSHTCAVWIGFGGFLGAGCSGFIVFAACRALGLRWPN